MRIAVVSPQARNNGNTTVSALLAMGLASTGKVTCVTHTSPISNSFYSYFGFTWFEDKTSTPSQLLKILKEGELQGDAVRDYCKDIVNNLDAFTNNATNFTQEDMNYMTDYIAKKFPHEHIVFDIDSTDEEQNKKIIKLCDVVVLVINQSVVELMDFKNNKDKYTEMFAGKPVVVVVNKYNSHKGSLKKTARLMGLKKPNNWLVLRENPNIPWGTNFGKLSNVFVYTQKKDPRVLDIKADLDILLRQVLKARQVTKKKGR